MLEANMPTYVVLGKLTQQGIQTIKDVPRRRAAADSAQALGITLRERMLTMGRYDVVMILDAPDDEAVAKFALQTGMRGNLSTETMRAFGEAERSAPRSPLNRQPASVSPAWRRSARRLISTKPRATAEASS
jgi:uncharacterized protein with GYD domain